MARKRVIEAPALKTWEDVNDALRQIAEAQIAVSEIESDMQRQIIGAQKVAEEQTKPYRDSVARLEREIKVFVTDHRDGCLLSGRSASGSPPRFRCPGQRKSWRRSSGDSNPGR